jgi:ABC-2 type transport system permease protein
MAGLAPRPEATHARSLPAAQLKAIAWLRWRQFVNGFRRKGGVGELVARVTFYPLLAAIALGPIAGGGLLGYFSIHGNSPALLATLTWAAFSAWLFITLGTTLQPPSMDLSLLLRFPMSLRTYAITRFLFGLLSPANVIGSLALAAGAIGIGLAKPALFPWAAVVLFSYALSLLVLLRTLLLWMDRWLAQRRTREIAGVLFTLFFLAFQFLNLRTQQSLAHGHHRGPANPPAHLPWVTPVWHALAPVLHLLPPSLAATSILRLQAGIIGPAIGCELSIVAFTGLCTALFLYRMRGEFRGENFNESPARTSAAKRQPGRSEAGLRISGLPPAIVACIEKELRYIVRAPSTLIGLAAPLVFITIYAQRLGSSDLLLPGALAYMMFSLLPRLYNVLGQDAAGTQLYLLSPTPLRQVFVAKNLVSSALLLLVAGTATLLITHQHPASPPVALATALWFAFVLLLNLSYGNLRSLSAPTKIDMNKIQRRQPTSRLSALLVLGILLGSLLLGYGVIWWSRALGHPWAASGVFLALTAGAVAVYLWMLRRIEGVALTHRDALIESLCKA